MGKHVNKRSSGYTCKCGRENPFTAYVFAHWDQEVTHVCECGLRWAIYAGEAELLKKGTHVNKRSTMGYEMTSVNLTKEDREIIDRVIYHEGMRMGEVIRIAIRKLGENYGPIPPDEERS